MSTSGSPVNPILIARFRAIQNIFFEQWRQVPLYTFPTFANFSEPSIQNPFAASEQLLNLVTTDEDDQGDAGGGGTMKGLRVEKQQPPAATKY